MTRAPHAVFKIPTKSPQRARGKPGRPADRAKAGRPAALSRRWPPMAQGWSHGPVGAVIAAWPAVSLAGSYELPVWIIRTAAVRDLVRGPTTDHGGPQAGHYGASLRLAAAQGPDGGPGNLIGHDTGLTPGGADGPLPVPGMAGAGLASRPGWSTADRADQMTDQADQAPGSPGPVITVGSDVDAAAVAAYRASVQAGKPLSERKLAGQFGKTSRCWARSRMAEAQQSPAPAWRRTGRTDRSSSPGPASFLPRISARRRERRRR